MGIKIVLLLLIPLTTVCQEIEWMVGFGGPKNDIAGKILTSQNGDIYISGYYGDEVNFDIVGGENLLISNFNQEYFFCKYNAEREAQWIQSLGPALFGTPAITNSNNNTVICRYSGLNNNFDGSIFLEKYNEDGSTLWSLNQDYLNTTNYIPKNTNALIPSFNERCDGGSYDDPIALVNNNGECIGQVYSDENTDLNGANVYHTYYSAEINTKIILSALGESKMVFNNQEITIGEGDIFEPNYYIKTYIIELDNVGNYVSHNLLNQGEIQDISGVQNWYFVNRVANDLSNAYTSGFTRGTFTFGDTTQFMNVPVVQKIGVDNNAIWSKAVNSIDGALNKITSINTINDLLIISGVFSGSIDIDLNEASEKIITSEVNGLSSYIAFYDKDGNYKNKFIYNDLSILDLAVNSDNTLISFGTYSEDNLAFDTKLGAYTLPNFGLEDLFLQKINYLEITNALEHEINNSLVFPNPFLNELFVKVDNQKISNCSIFNIYGELIFEQELRYGTNNIPLKEKGVFFLKISTIGQETEIHKIISN